MQIHFLDNEVVAIQVMAGAIIVLIALTVYLVLSSLFVRIINNRSKARHNAKKDECLPKILDYVFGNSEMDVRAIKKGLKKKRDYIPVLALIYDLLDQVEGSETTRIREILKMDEFRRFHRKLLRSSNKDDKMMACRYYSHLAEFDDNEYKSLKKFLSDRSLLVVHSSAVAIMSSSDVSKRAHALLETLKRPSVSKLAILELMYLFHHTENDHMDEEADYLLKMVKDPVIPDHHVGILIKGICDIGYVTLADPLFSMIESDYAKNREIVLEALIYAMGNMQYGLAAETIIEKYLHDERPRIRRACAALVEILSDPDYSDALLTLAKDKEFSVRVKAIYALAILGEPGKKILKELTEHTTELRLMINNIIAEVDQNYA